MKVDHSHEEFGERLKAAVSAYNSKHSLELHTNELKLSNEIQAINLYLV